MIKGSFFKKSLYLLEMIDKNEKQELFGNERLIRYAKDKKDSHIGEGLLDEIKKWRGNAIINDDLTMLEIWRDKF